MSLTFIALTGILTGFLCLVIAFLMDDAKGLRDVGIFKERRAVVRPRKKMVVQRKKAA
jgi:hypothetical protein